MFDLIAVLLDLLSVQNTFVNGGLGFSNTHVIRADIFSLGRSPSQNIMYHNQPRRRPLDEML